MIILLVDIPKSHCSEYIDFVLSEIPRLKQ